MPPKRRERLEGAHFSLFSLAFCFRSLIVPLRPEPYITPRCSMFTDFYYLTRLIALPLNLDSRPQSLSVAVARLQIRVTPKVMTACSMKTDERS